MLGHGMSAWVRMPAQHGSSSQADLSGQEVCGAPPLEEEASSRSPPCRPAWRRPRGGRGGPFGRGQQQDGQLYELVDVGAGAEGGESQQQGGHVVFQHLQGCGRAEAGENQQHAATKKKKLFACGEIELSART
jgi:hypothetical protein